MFPHSYMMGGWWWVIIPIFVVLVMAVFMFLTMGRLGRMEPYASDLSEAPLEILKKRYAKGEISKAEFEEMKVNLK